VNLHVWREGGLGPLEICSIYMKAVLHLVVLISEGYSSFMKTHLQNGRRWETAYTFVQHVNIAYIYRCPSRNVPNFGRVFLMLNYTDITQNTYIQS